MQKLWALLLAFVLIAAACGGSGSDAATSDGDADDTSSDTTGGDDDVVDTEDQVEVQDVDADQVGVAGETVMGEPTPTDRGPESSGTLDYSWHTAFSPKWFDPGLNTSSVSQFATQYVMHDALVKSMPDAPFTPSLAQQYTVAEDFTSVNFVLREGLTFHDGSTLTTEDVKFSFENYSGSGASTMQDLVKEIELVDDLSITFHFTAPFLDFMLLYGSTATGAGWIVPSDYYQEVGAEGFLEAPIGAGPFMFVENQDNVKIVYEAFPDYWKKNPGVQTINWNAITDPATRYAAVSTGELDLANVMTGDLLQTVIDDPDVELVPTTAIPFWIEFIGIADPESPFNDVRVREAVTLALDREGINQDETGGGGESTGQWIPRQQEGAFQAPAIAQDVDRAKELMAEAGYEDGFDVSALTPLPNYFSLGERVIQQLGEIGIRTSLVQMDRGEFLAQVNSGTDATFEGIVVNISGAGGDAAVRIRNFAECSGAASRICDPMIDEPFAEYEASTDPVEREALLNQIQQYIIDEHIFPYVYTLGLNHAQGPDVVQAPTEVWAQIPQYVYPGPWEDITVSN
ncbi:MAG: peptide/nickel transport system substrate-binding protein [Acidimicrobiales bacterium]|jgi:peptide/nickel transport system substrate-binding protein